MMEGVAAEAASLAGTFDSAGLIVLYDANRVTLWERLTSHFPKTSVPALKPTAGTCSRSTAMIRTAIDQALGLAQSVTDRPSLIVARTHIGYGSPNKQDTWHAHGEPWAQTKCV